MAHTDFDLQCLQRGWSDAVRKHSTVAGPLALMLVVSDSWVEWRAIAGRVLQRTPAEWRSAAAHELKALKHDVGALWHWRGSKVEQQAATVAVVHSYGLRMH